MIPNHELLPIRIETYTYKTVGDVEIKLDVHRRDDDRLRPVVVAIHGGALICGGRQSMSHYGLMMPKLLDAGYCVLAIDYRLAPETKLPEIVEDVEDVFYWIRQNSKDLFKGDSEKLAVFGTSAGGHLTLTSGFRAKPAADVLVSLWGYGDLIGPWLNAPSLEECHQMQVPDDTTDASAFEAEVITVVDGPAIANGNDREGNGAEFYRYCRRKGIWPEMVTGLDPRTEEDKYIPFMAAKNVSSHFPPTILLHGEIDNDVPHEQSEIMAREFRNHGVEHEFVTIKGGKHGLVDADPSVIDATYSKAIDFVTKYVPSPDA